MSTLVSSGMLHQLEAIGPFDAEACMNCGVCTATCPLGVELLPRRLFRYAALGLEDRVTQSSQPIFSCLLCRACEASCPAGVHITENMRVLRHWLLQEGF
jgi:heterodisulfide reductase subunit C